MHRYFGFLNFMFSTFKFQIIQISATLMVNVFGIFGTFRL